jgi:hypothetical protein
MRREVNYWKLAWSIAVATAGSKVGRCRFQGSQCEVLNMQSPRNTPIPLYEVLLEELARVTGGEKRKDYPGHHFEPDQIREAWQLAGKLVKGTEPIAKEVFGRMTPDEQIKVADEQTSPEELTCVLATALNRQLEDTKPCSKERFARVAVTTNVRQFEAIASTHDAIARNRAVLEKSFSVELAKLDDVRLKWVNRLLHEHHYCALCISGGGIRSATFALGVLQGLARTGLLERFDFLSTVSGGGYVGSWLSAWVHRHKRGLRGVINELAGNPRGPLEPEASPIRHLRSYSNYLTPKLGILSADTWTLIATYVRNLFLNWLILLPILLMLLAVPRVTGLLLMSSPHLVIQIVVLNVGCLCAVIALVYGGLFRPSLRDLAPRRDFILLSREGQGSFLRWCLAPWLTAAVCLVLFWAWHSERFRDPNEVLQVPARSPSVVPYILLGMTTHMAGWLVKAVWLKRWALPEFGAVVLTGGLGGAAVWVMTANIFSRMDLGLYACLAVPLFIGLLFVLGTIYAGLLSQLWTDDDREWLARFGAWILIGALCWITIHSLVIYGPYLLFALPKTIASLGGGAGILTLAAGRSGSTPANSQKSAMSLAQIIDKAIQVLAAPMFAASLVILLSLLTDFLLFGILPMTFAEHVNYLRESTPMRLAVLFVSLLLVGAAASLCININKFSLHGMYRNRLIRAYLGASRYERRPNCFTGFDPDDNLRLHEFVHARPLHIINMALNLVSGQNLAWQERKAESFTASPLHCGSHRLGYRESQYYGGPGGISVGTCVAISGAAASPNMGYHSSPIVAFLMTLFNTRLGWWLPNPISPSKTCRRATPSFAAKPLLDEALGLTDDQHSYVYLSDGGHFENLGLYEMVLRRCHRIFVSDAGCDPRGAFDDLGNAIRKIRIDLGISIVLAKMMIIPRTANELGKYCAIGTIKYSAVDGEGINDGMLIYLKPAYYGDEPIDIFNYAQTSQAFPHESTADQWFSESQFESYRALGQHCMQQVFDGRQSIALDEVINMVQQYLSRAQAHANNVDESKGR